MKNPLKRFYGKKHDITMFHSITFFFPRGFVLIAYSKAPFFGFTLSIFRHRLIHIKWAPELND